MQYEKDDTKVSFSQIILKLLLTVYLTYLASPLFQWGVLELADNYPEEKYYYLITVYTGMRRGAGTTSSVSFVLGGATNTGIRRLSDGYRQVCQRPDLVIRSMDKTVFYVAFNS